MPNMGALIKKHNSKILRQDNNQEQNGCHCRIKADCPLPGRCSTPNVVYEATVNTRSEEKTYIGLTSLPFKKRYNQHKASFTHRWKSSQTELSNYVWKLKDKNTAFTITWKIKQRAQPYSPVTKRCDLCLCEKLHILKAEKGKSLNFRTELVGTCMHKKKWFLSEVPDEEDSDEENG